MPDLAMHWSLNTDRTDCPRNVPAFRTLLAGDLAAFGCQGRRRIEGMLATASGGRPHQVLPGCRDGCPIEQAEAQLGRDAVDIVVLDLDGPIEIVLSLVKRLRAAAGDGVVFVGIHARHATVAARLYLSAVVDEVVEAQSRACGLHRAIADALEAASDFQGRFGVGLSAGQSEMRH